MKEFLRSNNVNPKTRSNVDLGPSSTSKRLAAQVRLGSHINRGLSCSFEYTHAEMALVQIQDVQGGKAVEGDDRESKRPRSDGTESARDGRSPGKKELN